MSDRTVQLSVDDQRLKSATKSLVKSFGGQEAAAEHTGKRQQYFSECGLKNVAKFMGIEDVADLERNTHGMHGHPHVTRALCQNAGGVYVPLPDICGGSGPIAEGFAALGAEFGESARAIGMALADLTVDSEEAKKCHGELQDVVNQAVALQHQLQMIIDGDAE